MLGPQPSFQVKGGPSTGSQSIVLSAQDSSVQCEPEVPQDKRLNNYTELLDIKILKEVRAKFLEYGTGETGDAVKVEDFIEILSAYMPRQDVDKIYMKIDVNDDGFVDWHEFTGFLINADAMKGVTSYGPTYRPAERICQPHDRHVHRDMIEHLAFSMKPLPMVVTGCKDGSISLWSYNDLTYVGSVAHYDKSSIMMSSMIRNIDTAQKAAVKVAVGRLSRSSPSEGVCITALSALSTTGHLCVASADCSLAVYDLATQESCGRLNNTVEMLTSLAAFQAMDKRMDVLVPYIVTGDCLGYISVIKIDHEFKLSADGGQKKKNQLIMEKALIVGLNRSSLHADWITKLFFLPELEQVISSSMDGTIKFINLDKMTVYREFRGHNATGASVHVGVKNFVWAPMQKYVCSVGTDRVILMWDPYTMDVMCKLSGLASPVLELAVDERHQQIIASTQKKCIRTWDSVTYEAMEPLEDRAEYVPANEISCSLWVPEMEGLVTAANKLKLYCVEKSPELGATVEQDDLLCVLFNEIFSQVVVVSNSGRVKVYLSDDGSLVTHFDAQAAVIEAGQERTREQELGSFVKDAAFDGPKRRLIMITTTNGIHFWNCHNGSNLCMVTPRVPPYLQAQMAGIGTASMDITCFIHATIFFPATHSGGGGISSRTAPKKYLLLGLHNGVIIGLHEGDELSEDASILLVRSSTTRAIGPCKGGQLDAPSSLKQSSVPSSADQIAGAIGRKAHEGSTLSVAPRQTSCGVLWITMTSSDESKMFAGYNDGIILLWDVGTLSVIMRMEGDTPGASFSCMRRRIIASRNRAPPMTVYLEQQRKLQRQRSGEDELKRLKEGTKEVESRQGKVMAPQDITHFNYSYVSVENDMVPKESAVLGTGASLASQTIVSRPLNLSAAARPKSASATRHTVQVNSVANSLVKPNAPFGFHSLTRGTMVGIGRGRGDGNRRNPEKLSLSSIAMRPTNSAQIDPGVDLEANNSYYSSHGSAVGKLPSHQTEGQDGEIEGAQHRPFSKTHSMPLSREGSTDSRGGSRSGSRPHSGAMRKAYSCAEAWSDTYKSRPGIEQEQRSNPLLPATVFHSVVSSRYRLMFGACSDSLLRVWDLDGGGVICSCALIHSHREIKALKKNGEEGELQHDDSESSVSKLCLSERSNHVIAGYDDGLIRIWIMGPHSTGQLRTVTVTDGGELAIPPLQYHKEWLAHETAISGVAVVNRDAPNLGHVTYLVTSAQAQGVYLWTISGKLVGTFGVSEWAIGDSLTWKPKPIDIAELKINQTTAQSRRQPTVITNPSGERSMPGYEWGDGLSRGLKLALYMEKLQLRVQTRIASSTYAMQDGHFSEVQDRHPVVDPKPPTSPNRSSHNRTARKDRHVYHDMSSSMGGSNAGNYPIRKIKPSSLADKLKQVLTTTADQSLYSLLGNKDQSSFASQPNVCASEKLRSAAAGIQGFNSRSRRNSGGGANQVLGSSPRPVATVSKPSQGSHSESFDVKQ